MSCENLGIYDKSSAINDKSHFLWRLDLRTVVQAATTTPKLLLASSVIFEVSFTPHLEENAFGVFKSVRTLRACRVGSVSELCMI